MPMLYSMTGYGKAHTEINGTQYEVEIKSLNSKYFDLQTRLPNGLRQKEMDFRKMLESGLVRGKITFQITLDASSELTARKLNRNVLQNYLNEINEIFTGLNQSEIIASLLRHPDIWIQESDEDVESVYKNLIPVVEKAVEEVTVFRKQEGESIEKDIRQRLSEIGNYLARVESLAPVRLEKIKAKLSESIKSIKDQADENRFEQELIYYLEKLDINEEIIRLKNHLNYFEKTMNGPGVTKGKKLNFIAQEMGREINTIGSKANDAGIQHLVVQMKDALEKIKEQSGNVL